MNRCLRLTSLIVIAASVALRAGQNPPAAQQPPTFQAEVEYVEVDAIVTDGQGRAVRDLTQEDFQVLEDGKVQKISAFSFVDLPVERYQPPQPLGATQSIEPDVKSNARPFDGRVYVMVIDDLHTATLRTQLVKNAAKQFIQRNLGANDLMAVVHTFGPTDASQDFTNSKPRLLAAVDRTHGQKVQSETLSRNEAYARSLDYRNAGDPVFDPNDVERAYQARSTLDFLKRVADWFAGVHGRRKSILFVSEGIDYNIYDIMGNGFVPNTFIAKGHSGSTMIGEALRDVITSATRSNVSIYGIDPRGLTGLADDSVTVESFPTNEPELKIGQASLTNEVQLSQNSLRALSEETSGFAVVNRTQFADAYQRIVEDNSAYYELAYYPPTDKRDGKYHNIQVRVNRPGLTVRARKGWMAPKGKPAAPAPVTDPAAAALRDAVNNPLPVGGLKLQMFAAPFKGTAPNASVLIDAELVGRDMKLAPGDKLRVLYVAVDAHDKVVSKPATVTMNFRPETQAAVEKSGLRVLGRMDLPPGRYQLRYAVHESGANVVGSVRYDLDVPDFTKPPLSMSGLVLTSALGSKIPTAAPDAELSQVMPGPPVASRMFGQNDELAVFVEVYDNQPAKPHKVDITTTIVNDVGTVLFKNEQVRDAADLQGKPGGYGLTTRIPLNELAPGSYVLKVAAHSRLGQEATIDRQILITIIPASPAVPPPQAPSV